MALTPANSAHQRLPIPRPPTTDPRAEPLPLTGFEQMSPLIRLMVVCVSDTMPVSLLTSTLPTDHGAWIGGTPVSYLWVRSGVKPWQRRHLIGVGHSRHTPVLCAGGPIRWLDLDGMRDAAAFAAGVRHHQWTHVVRGTRQATPWHQIRTAPPGTPSVAMAAAWRRYTHQPRIVAMRAFTAAHLAGPVLDPDEVEMYQAGLVAYQQYHAMRAICGDAILTTNGRLLHPRGDSLADRITYLHHAMRLLHALPNRRRLLAITPPDTATTAT
jgi:hypothetical protein